MRPGRLAITAAVLVTTTGAIAGPAASSAAAPARPVVVAIGIPGEDLGTQPDAGAVEVRQRGRSPQVIFPSDYRAGDRFGSTVELLEMTGDFHEDLLVGAPGRDVDGVADAGAIYLYRGSATGFRLLRVLSPGKPGVPGPAQTGAGFGSTIGTWPGTDSFGILAGVPGWDVGTAKDAGAVIDLLASKQTNPEVNGKLLTQGSGQIPDTPEAGDRFGAKVVSASPWFVASAPGESVDGAAGAGAVVVQDEAGHHLITQNTPGMPGTTAEAGDGFGSTLLVSAGTIYIGVPGEDLGSITDAGIVNSLWSEGTPWTPGPGFSQNTDGVEGAAEAGDRFGAALASLEVGEDVDYEYVKVGVPGEDIGTVRDAGMVNVLNSGRNYARSHTQNTTAGIPQTGDRFGASLAADTEFGDLFVHHSAIGAPGEDNGAGAIVVGDQGWEIWKQVTGSPEAGDGYGSAVAIEP